ncbi:MAG: lactate utilization protein [Synergistaceae bacterium]|jgi:L-lactate utilization protein LutB|nr:lactate utilization protein [Synergistaceae bacterium]
MSDVKVNDALDAARVKAQGIVAQSVAKALQAKGYEAVAVGTKEEALAEVLKLIPAGASVGVPGTVTVREIGAMEKLAERGCTIYEHWSPNIKPEDRMRILDDENHADYLLTSANAITRDGKILNIDGTGNRVSGMAWGRGTLIFVIGVNKVVPDLEAGLQRVHMATLPNSLRLNITPPCAQTGFCVDCDSPARTCRALLILERAVNGRKTHVIMVGENLGY